MDPVVIEEKITVKVKEQVEDRIEVKDVIKTVRCIFLFDNYSAKKFKQDFDEFVLYQKKIKVTKGNVEHKMYYDIKEFTEIPFEYFVQCGTRLFSRATFYLLRQNPEFILSNELNIEITFKRVPNMDYFFDLTEETTTKEKVCFTGAGMYFLTNIVGPFFYLKKHDYTIIIRYLRHELTHYVDLAHGLVSYEDSKYEKKIQDRVGIKSAYGINYLYYALFNLRDEGLAEFVNRSESPEIEIDADAIFRYNHNLRTLAAMMYKKKACEFYEEVISHNNLSPDGEYAIGRNMCLIICLALAKKYRSPYIIRVNKEEFFGFEFDKLDHYLSYGAKIYVLDLKKDLILKTIDTIRPTKHYYFIKMYEDACDVLGISEANRAMTRRRFYDLVKLAKDDSKFSNRGPVEKARYILFDQIIHFFSKGVSFLKKKSESKEEITDK